MPGRHPFPRPSRRLRQTRLEPRERQQKLESHDLPGQQGFYHPESAYLEKAPTAQFMPIDAADRLFSVRLTGITSVPECAVSSVGFLWGSAAVSLSCGVSVGLAEAHDWADRPTRGTQVPPTSGS